MTISTSVTFEFNIAQIVRMGHVDAGLLSIYQSPNVQQMADGTDKLQRELNALQAKALFARVVDFFNLTPLVSGVDRYEMPAYVLDLVGNGMYVPPGESLTQSNAETLVKLITRSDWQEQSAKGAVGRPTLFYAHRTTSIVEARLWPVPGAGEAGGTIRFPFHRFRADAKDPNSTMDFERFWTDYLVANLSYRLAMSAGLSESRCAMLQADMASKLGDCRKYSMQRGDQRMVLRHRTGWNCR